MPDETEQTRDSKTAPALAALELRGLSPEAVKATLDLIDQRMEELELRLGLTDPAPPTFTIGISPGDASPEELSSLLIALSELHKASGGRGLDFDFNESTAEGVAP